MARYGRDLGYNRQSAARGPGGRSGYGRDVRRDEYDRSYSGGWGMTHLYNTVMRGGPRGEERYGAEFYHRPSGTPYGHDFRDRPAPRRTEAGRGRGRGASDRGSIGVHLRGYDRF